MFGAESVLNNFSSSHEKSVEEDYILIDSSLGLQRAKGQANFTKLHIKGDSDFLVQFFDPSTEKNFTSITHLHITSHKFSCMYHGFLGRLIRNGLTSLKVDCDKLNGPDILLENLNFYSALEVLEFNSKSYKKDKFSSSEFFLRAPENVREKCKKIINLNREIKCFLKELPERLTGIKDIQEVKLDNLTSDQIKCLIEIGQNEKKYLNYKKFHEDLTNNDSFQLLLKIARQWDIQNIVSCGDVKRLNTIIKYNLDKNFSLNKRFFIRDKSFQRLIDIAASNGQIEMVRFLAEQGAELTFDYIGENIFNAELDMHSVEFRRLANFPFYTAIHIQTKEQFLEIVLGNECALYDGLAWFIRLDDFEGYNRIKEKIKIDWHKQIPEGAFKNFTLFQLLLYFMPLHYTGLINDLLLSLEGKFKLALANQLYPDYNEFDYKNWSLLATLIYRGLNEVLTIFLCEDYTFRDIELTNNHNYSAIQLVLAGARECFNLLNNSLNNNENKKKKQQLAFKNSLKQIIEFYKIDLSTLSIPYNDNEIPLLHYAIITGIFSIACDSIAISSKYLRKKVNLSSHEYELNLFQCAVIYYVENRNSNNTTDIEYIFKKYSENDLLECLSEPMPSKGDMNIFQYIIRHRRDNLLAIFLNAESCPVNIPFPKSDTRYPGWLPIHVAIINVKIFDSRQLALLLEKSDLDITQPFLEDGVAHYLSGYYPLSSLFFQGNPLKNDNFPAYDISKYTKKMLSCSKDLSIEKKQVMLDQALAYAVLYHDIKQDLNFSEEITALLESGANAAQNFDFFNQIMPIFDLAREKGILYLFPEHLKKNGQKKLLNGALKKIENERYSELNPNYLINETVSVVSLARHKKGIHREHVFIIVERIENGHAQIHFCDFINKNQKNSGDVRWDPYEGKINESLLSKWNSPNLHISSREDIVAQSWQIPASACIQMLENIKNDKESNNIPYSILGDQSIARSSLKTEAHNCYSWARKKLISTQSTPIKQALKSKFDEMLIAVPSLKLPSKDSIFYRNKYVIGAFGVVLTSFLFYNFNSNEDYSMSNIFNRGVN